MMIHRFKLNLLENTLELIDSIPCTGTKNILYLEFNSEVELNSTCELTAIFPDNHDKLRFLVGLHEITDSVFSPKDLINIYTSNILPKGTILTDLSLLTCVVHLNYYQYVDLIQNLQLNQDILYVYNSIYSTEFQRTELRFKEDV